MSHTEFHEDAALLSEKTKDMHRAIVSLMEELEAVDWYQQRADACKDASLRAILVHNMEEEIEHAAMALEWLRRNHAGFAEQLKTYLFTSAAITEIEEGEGEPGDARQAPPPPSQGSLRTTIGALRRGP